jgi:cysteinyl-tRNA synthetase
MAPSESQESWALAWARRRKHQKTAKNYAEADRIRELLRAAGWEVRDKPDGSVEVVRIKRAS